MGFRISFIAAKMPAEELASALGMEVAGQERCPIEGTLGGASQARVSASCGPKTSFSGDAALLTLSKNGTVLNCSERSTDHVVDGLLLPER